MWTEIQMDKVELKTQKAKLNFLEEKWLRQEPPHCSAINAFPNEEC
jgi:hypothetical protein